MNNSINTKYVIEKSSFFNRIAYSTCWEDFDIINKALKIKKGDTILSITSGGCNVLNFLIYAPRKIIAVDFNPNQNHILTLKIIAIKHLNHEEFIELLGVVKTNKSLKIYGKIREYLPKETQIFWDNKCKIIKKGITYNGRQERYIHSIGQYLRYLKGEDVLIDFLRSKSLKEQTVYFNKHLKDFSWKLYFNAVYNKPVMMIAKDKFVFNQIEDSSYHIKFRKRVENAAINVQAKNNPFMSFALLGYYLDGDYYPHYLKKKNFEYLKKRADQIDIKTGPIQEILKELPTNSIDKFNLSNVLDWTSLGEFKKILQDLIRVGKHKSRFCYLNTLMKRHIPNFTNIKSYKKEANNLLKKDKSFLYENFEIGEILKEK